MASYEEVRDWTDGPVSLSFTFVARSMVSIPCGESSINLAPGDSLQLTLGISVALDFSDEDSRQVWEEVRELVAVDVLEVARPDPPTVPAPVRRRSLLKRIRSSRPVRTWRAARRAWTDRLWDDPWWEE